MIDWLIVDLTGDWIIANLLILDTGKESYWKYAYEVCGLELYTEESSTQYKRIDPYWSYVENWLGTMVNQSVLSY